MKILICSATKKESEPFYNELIQNLLPDGSGILFNNKHLISFLTTGVGGTATVYSLATFPDIKNYDFLIQIGIAGSYQKNIPTGSVVEVVSEQFGDLGAENKDDTFLDVFELGLSDKNLFPFINGRLINANPLTTLPKVHGVTVHKVLGTEKSIDTMTKKYNPDIETMEGATFFYSALMLGVPFCQIRGISNKVEPRSRETWNIPLALKNLGKETLHILQSLP
jgi:futalosine hydrolase